MLAMLLFFHFYVGSGVLAFPPWLCWFMPRAVCWYRGIEERKWCGMLRETCRCYVGVCRLNLPCHVAIRSNLSRYVGICRLNLSWHGVL